MPRPKKSTAELRLVGNASKLSREELAARADEEKQPLSASLEQELKKLDELIEIAMRECRKGQRLRNGRRNPAFQNLNSLLRSRKTLLTTPRPAAGVGEPDELQKYLSGPKSSDENYFQQIDTDEEVV